MGPEFRAGARQEIEIDPRGPAAASYRRVDRVHDRELAQRARGK